MTDVNEFLKVRAAAWLFGACLIVFIFLKIPHLSLPFFWDEAGVYGRMIFTLAIDGLSLHPVAIDQWISRGHPLLYPNIIASFCRLLGDNVTVAHSTNFAIACLLLVSMFKCLGKAFHPWIGAIACILLMTQPIFYAQSVFVLPEITLAFFLWWTTWFFIQKKYFLYFLAGTAAVLTKEPAIIWILSLTLWDLASRRLKSLKSLLWLTPLIPFCVFIYFQKQTYGWYFFPYHTSGFDLNIKNITSKLIDFLEFIFWKNGRIVWLFILLVSVFGSFIIKRREDAKTFLPKFDRRYLVGLFAGMAYLVFSSTTFFGERYVIAVLPIATSLVAYAAYYFVFRKQVVLILIFLTGMGILSLQYMNSDKFLYDNDMSYIRSINSSKKTIQYMLDRNMLNQDEFSATVPLLFALSDTRFGYLPKDTTSRYSTILHEGSKYAVQVVPGTQIENPENRPLELLDEWYDGDIITRIYKVLPMDSIGIQ